MEKKMEAVWHRAVYNEIQIYIREHEWMRGAQEQKFACGPTMSATQFVYCFSCLRCGRNACPIHDLPQLWLINGFTIYKMRNERGNRAPQAAESNGHTKNTLITCFGSCRIFFSHFNFNDGAIKNNSRQIKREREKTKAVSPVRAPNV